MTKTSVWDTYANSYIIDASNAQIIWSGPNAIELLPIATPIHIITAHNPFEQRLLEQENVQRNHSLLTKLEKPNLTIRPVIGSSPNRDWQEASFATHGLNREQACAIALGFKQRGIFELSDKEMLVIEANSALIKGKRKRIL